MRRFRVRLIDGVGTRLPSQRQSPGLDSTVGVIVPRGAKFDVLSRLVVRKYLLYPFVKPLGKRVQILGGVESRTPQHP